MDFVKKKDNLALLFIAAIAIVTRMVMLDKVPPGLFGDELDVGYQAFSLLHTGKDYMGNLLPTYAQSFSEWRAPLIMYATVPFVAVFGLNDYGIRLAPALFGVLNVALLYLLASKLINKRVAMFSAFLLALSPWHLQYSRASFEVTLLLVLVIGGALLYIKGLKQRKYLFVSAVLFALTLYTYSPANVFTPLFMVLLFVNFKKAKLQLEIKKHALPLMLFVILSIPIAYQSLFGFAAERYSKFSIFNDPAIVEQVGFKRSVGEGKLEILLHNRPVLASRKIVNNYFQAFSPRFLFIDGDVTFRHSIHEIGEFYWIELPLIVVGLYLLRKQKNRTLLYGWLVISPIPAALTRDGDMHATRLFVLLPILVIFAAAGANEIFYKQKRKLLSSLVLLVFIFELVFYFHRYWVHYPVESWRWWHVGYKESIQFIKEREDDYEFVAFNNTYEPSLIRFLVWWNYPADKFLYEFKGENSKENIIDKFDGFELENRYYFGRVPEDQQIFDFLNEDTIYLVSQRDEVPGDWDWEKDTPGGVTVLKTIRNPFGEPLFYVVTGVAN